MNNFWQSQDSNPGLLGEKHKRYLCAMQPPQENKLRPRKGDKDQKQQQKVFFQNFFIHFFSRPPKPDFFRSMQLRKKSFRAQQPNTIKKSRSSAEMFNSILGGAPALDTRSCSSFHPGTNSMNICKFVITVW